MKGNNKIRKKADGETHIQKEKREKFGMKERRKEEGEMRKAINGG